MKQTNQQKKHFVTIIVLAFSQVTETEKWGGRKVFGMFLSFLFPTEQIEKRLCPLCIHVDNQKLSGEGVKVLKLFKTYFSGVKRF